MFGSPSGGLGNHACGDDSVFVADEVACQVTIAFFATSNKLFLAFEFKDFVCDVLEAGQHIVSVYIVFLGYLKQQLGGNDGLHYVLFSSEFA